MTEDLSALAAAHQVVADAAQLAEEVTSDLPPISELTARVASMFALISIAESLERMSQPLQPIQGEVGVRDADPTPTD